jgi:hypothetical protein
MSGPGPGEEPGLAADMKEVRRWIGAHPAAEGSVSVDRSASDAGQGEPLLVLTVSDDPTLHREGLVPLLVRPDRLRVRRYRPAAADLDRVLRWVVETQMAPVGEGGTVVTSAGIDEPAGRVVVSLNRADEEYARELMSRAGGLISVAPQPLVVVAIPPAPAAAPPGRAPR